MYKHQSSKLTKKKYNAKDTAKSVLPILFLKEESPSCKSPESDQRIKKTDVYLDYAGDFLRNIPLIWRFRGSQPNILK